MSLSSVRTNVPHSRGKWNADVDPPDFNQLKLGPYRPDVDPPDFNQLKLGPYRPLPQSNAEFSSAQAPS